MKIAIAQIRPAKGDIQANIEKHKVFIEMAIALKANSIFFPELSLTGYEPELAKRLATNQEDTRLDVFQKWTNIHKITIGLGIPTKAETDVKISMVIFQPGAPKQTYSKQQLHSDEFPYFTNGKEQIILTIDHHKVAPAICYESLQPIHADNASKLGADVYMASVAKSQNGINKAIIHYPAMAKKHGMSVLMSNCVGYCDKFNSAGQSAVWTKTGQLVAQLDDIMEGMLVFDTETEAVIKQTIGDTL